MYDLDPEVMAIIKGIPDRVFQKDVVFCIHGSTKPDGNEKDLCSQADLNNHRIKQPCKAEVTTHYHALDRQKRAVLK